MVPERVVSGMRPTGLLHLGHYHGVLKNWLALQQEYECLFFVALSRARDRLLLYSPTQKSNGSNWPRSAFVDRLGHCVTHRRVSPRATLPPDDCNLPVALTLESGMTLRDSELALYQRCPRRFFYTHVLEIGGRRTETAFMQMHDAVQRVIDVFTFADDGEVFREKCDAAFEEAWISHGPTEHGYANEYKQIALSLVRFLKESTNGYEIHKPPQLRLSVSGGEVIVTPDLVVSDSQGRVIMRKVRTGHQSDKESNGIAAAAFHLAATAHTPGCKVELVHLSDAEVTSIQMTGKVLSNRQSTLQQISENVRSGHFPLEEGMACPRCPAFFVCGRLPSGQLVKKLSE